MPQPMLGNPNKTRSQSRSTRPRALRGHGAGDVAFDRRQTGPVFCARPLSSARYGTELNWSRNRGRAAPCGLSPRPARLPYPPGPTAWDERAWVEFLSAETLPALPPARSAAAGPWRPTTSVGADGLAFVLRKARADHRSPLTRGERKFFRRLSVTPLRPSSLGGDGSRTVLRRLFGVFRTPVRNLLEGRRHEPASASACRMPGGSLACPAGGQAAPKSAASHPSRSSPTGRRSRPALAVHSLPYFPALARGRGLTIRWPVP